jgi:hypothetical protein
MRIVCRCKDPNDKEMAEEDECPGRARAAHTIGRPERAESNPPGRTNRIVSGSRRREDGRAGGSSEPQKLATNDTSARRPTAGTAKCGLRSFAM